MSIRKIFSAILFTFLPPLFIIATTPLSSLSDHVNHIILFGVLGFGMTVFSLRNDLKKTKRITFLPSFSALIFTILLTFIAMHTMPCQYMFSSNTAQTMIYHPCSQPTPACTAVFSFTPTVHHLALLTIFASGVPLSDTPQTTASRAPPFI